MESLKNKIKEKRITVGILGLGYVGLPLAVEFAKAGFSTIGFDIDAAKIKDIQDGHSYINDVSDETLKTVQSNGKFIVSNDKSIIKDMDAVIVSVPTPLSKTKDPDLSFVISATEMIKKNLRNFHIISFESTTYPGTTEEIIRPILEETGLRAGTDFFLAFSPERIDPGNSQYNVHNTPKLVGGIDPLSTDIVALVYEGAIQHVIRVSSSKVAETAKLLENTFRSINIGLANEVAIMCNILGIDSWEVINAASTKPFGFMKFYPGPGIGGHCIPIDPVYLSWKMKTLNYTARFIELATDINAYMPRYVVSRIQDALNEKEKSIKGSHILILGVTYKKDIDDLRESPVIDIITLLEQKGAKVEFYDPYVNEIEISGLIKESIRFSIETLQNFDIVVLGTDHTAFDYNSVYKHAAYIFDTRNAFRNAGIKDNTGKIVVI